MSVEGEVVTERVVRQPVDHLATGLRLQDPAHLPHRVAPVLVLVGLVHLADPEVHVGAIQPDVRVQPGGALELFLGDLVRRRRPWCGRVRRIDDLEVAAQLALRLLTVEQADGIEQPEPAFLPQSAPQIGEELTRVAEHAVLGTRDRRRPAPGPGRRVRDRLRQRRIDRVLDRTDAVGPPLPVGHGKSSIAPWTTTARVASTR